MSGGAYLQYSRRSVVELLTRNAFALTSGLSAILYLAVRRTIRHHAIADHLAIAGAGFLIAVVVQGKGYGYHYFPTLGASVVLLTLVLSRTGDPRPALRRATAVVCAVCLLALGSGLLLHTAMRPGGGAGERDRPRDAGDGELRAESRGRVAGGGPVGPAGGRLSHGALRRRRLGAQIPQPLVRAGLRAAGERRTTCPRSPGGRVARWARTGAQPAGLVLVRRTDAPGELDAGVDYLAFLGRDATFAQAFSRYRKVGDQGPYGVYRAQAINGTHLAHS